MAMFKLRAVYTETSTRQRLAQEQIDAAVESGRLVLDGESPQRGPVVWGMFKPIGEEEAYPVEYVKDGEE